MPKLVLPNYCTITVTELGWIFRFDKVSLTHEIISYGSRPPSSGDALAWTNSTFNEPLPISYGLIPIDQVITDVYLKRYGIDDATLIRKSLQKYLEVRRTSVH